MATDRAEASLRLPPERQVAHSEMPGQQPRVRPPPATPAVSAPRIPERQHRQMWMMMMSPAAPRRARKMRETTTAAMRVAPEPMAPPAGPPPGQRHQLTRRAPLTSSSTQNGVLPSGLRPISSSHTSSFQSFISFTSARHEAYQRLSPCRACCRMNDPVKPAAALQRLLS